MDVPESSIALDDLVELKMLPAWANEPAPADRYAHIDGDERGERKHDRPGRERPPRKGPTFKKRLAGPEPRPGEKANERFGRNKRNQDRPPVKNRTDFAGGRENRPSPVEHVLPKIEVRFLPRAPVLENIVAQIKEDNFAYSLFALARLFLAKPERYEVRLTATEQSPLFRLGENGETSADREFLERSAFRLAQTDFYKIEVAQSDPIKGNFTSVARDRLSGTILGPTNHHDYQKRLRGLYEQRFSRRMSFGDYQRQIEIVSDPQLVEQWKEDARKITTYVTLQEEPPITFPTAAEAEGHFREKYLPQLVGSVAEVSIDGLTSRRLGDRALYRLVENEWTRENGSPSRIMPELAARFREAGLQVFRHRRGMLFVSPIRPQPLVQENAAISLSVRSVIETLGANPRINRKDLADKVLSNLTGEELERAKLTLASDLRWLVSAGHLIEFNDGSLDLPRVKVKQPQTESVEAAVSAAEDPNQDGAAAKTPTENSTEVDAARSTVPVEGQALETSAAAPIEVKIGDKLDCGL